MDESENIADAKSTEKHLGRIILGVLFTVISLLVILFVVAKIYVPPDLSAQIKEIFAQPEIHFSPELTEKLLFLTGILLTPVLLLVWHIFLAKYLENKLQLDSKIVKFSGIIVYSSFAAISILFLTDFMVVPDYFSLLKGYMPLPVIVFLAVLSCVCSYFLIYKENSVFKERFNYLLSFLPYTLFITVFLYCLIDKYNFIDAWQYTVHFNLVLDPVVQVFSGKELLVDFTHQYGLYPHFLAPIFKIFGLSVLKFSVVMGLLLVLSFYLIHKFLKEAVKTSYLAPLGLLTIVFCGYYSFRVTGFDDPVFLFHPIRYIFPALAIYLSWKYFISENKLVYFIIFPLYSIAILWNFDTGAVIFISWLLVLCCKEFSKRSIFAAARESAIHAGWSLLSIAGVITVYMLLMKIFYGHFPDFSLLLKYHRYYFYYGFALWPMPLVHPWHLVVLIYITGLSIAIKRMLDKNMDPITQMIFFLSIFGIGIFSYYQGRSHDYNLLYVTYPAILLFTIFTDKIIKFQQQYKPVAAIALGFLIFTGVCMVSEYTFLYPKLIDRYTIIINKKPSNITENIEFIRENTKPGEKVLILSNQAGIYYLESQTICPIGMPTLTEMLAKKDYKPLFDFIVRNRDVKVFIGIDIITLSPYLNPTKLALLNLILKTYDSVGLSKNQTLQYFVSKN